MNMIKSMNVGTLANFLFSFGQIELFDRSSLYSLLRARIWNRRHHLADQLLSLEGLRSWNGNIMYFDFLACEIVDGQGGLRRLRHHSAIRLVVLVWWGGSVHASDLVVTSRVFFGQEVLLALEGDIALVSPRVSIGLGAEIVQIISNIDLACTSSRWLTASWTNDSTSLNSKW